MRRLLTVLCALGVLLGLTPAARADIGRFEIDGRIYTKHLYQNNDSQGLVGLGNPFWPDTISGNNGVGSELELNIRGKVSSMVETGARLASRFGERWHDWWESGNSLYDSPNTSGDSGGMNSASYMKLRGTYIQVMPGILGIDWIRAGSSDLGMFNPWTIGKVRYIDRDNGRGYFAAGHIGEDDGSSLELGIGGTRKPERLKCLHAHVAFALANPGYAVGEGVLAELPERWPTDRCCSEPPV